MKPKLFRFVFIVILAATVFIASIGFAEPEVDWWPMFHHDTSHIGFSTSGAPNSNETLWTYQTKHQIKSSPVVFEGMIFIGSYDNYLYALNATTGQLIWKYETGGDVFSSPCVQDGRVFISAR